MEGSPRANGVTKKVIYTQRVQIIEDYGERRDCADQRVAGLLWECGYVPVCVNNIPERAEEFAQSVRPCGIMLTGGNDLAKYGGDAPERDETEYLLIKYGIENDIPIYGFCRGMQVIADYFGAALERVEGHVAKRHLLTGKGIRYGREVNSFHKMAVKDVKEPLLVEARSEDGSIEAFTHQHKRIFAVMWHPERETPYAQEDIQYIRNIFS